ncbi:MAG: MerR family transcriptional regulator [Mycobacteriales bacterium]
MSGPQHVQIGDVAERTGLSLRTIRWYEEVGLVPPSARTPGGFRLYTDSDIERLEIVKRMKPLELTLEEMRDLLSTIDALDAPSVPAGQRAGLRERLVMYQELAEQRVEALRGQLANAEMFAHSLAERVGSREGVRRRSR